MGWVLGLLTTLQKFGSAPILPELRLIPAKASMYDWQVLPGVGLVLAGHLYTALHRRSRVNAEGRDDVHAEGRR
jgi:hypothetical protein